MFHPQTEAGLTAKKENTLDVLRISYLRKRTLILGSVWCDLLSTSLQPIPFPVRCFSPSPDLAVGLTSPLPQLAGSPPACSTTA